MINPTLFYFSLEYERSEVNAGMFYKNAQEREKMAKIIYIILRLTVFIKVAAEQRFVADRCNKVIAFKNQVRHRYRPHFVLVFLFFI